MRHKKPTPAVEETDRPGDNPNPRGRPAGLVEPTTYGLRIERRSLVGLQEYAERTGCSIGEAARLAITEFLEKYS